MRFDNNVKFYSESEEHYDPSVGDYVGGSELVHEAIANVTDVGTDRSQAVFGDVNSRQQVIRLACPVGVSWAYCLIDDDTTEYIQTTMRNPLKAHTLIVGERHG